MTFGDTNHIHAIKEIEGLWDNLLSLERFAKQYGIDDFFQDNGAKVVQQLVYLNMSNIPGREGNDGRSENGMEWEMKSINLDMSANGFSTNQSH